MKSRSFTTARKNRKLDQIWETKSACVAWLLGSQQYSEGSQEKSGKFKWRLRFHALELHVRVQNTTHGLCQEKHVSLGHIILEVWAQVYFSMTFKKSSHNRVTYRVTAIESQNQGEQMYFYVFFTALINVLRYCNRVTLSSHTHTIESHTPSSHTHTLSSHKIESQSSHRKEKNIINGIKTLVNFFSVFLLLIQLAYPN